MKSKPNNPKLPKSRLYLLHQYYRYTGFYKFVWNGIKKALPIITIFVALIYTLDYFFGINETLVHLTEILPVFAVLSFFFTSEVFLGLIPPEIFIAWAGKLYNPWLFLALLAILSYTAGLIAYWLGIYIEKTPRVHNYVESKMKKQLKNSKKWGGFLILVGALLPLPFSISCIAAGIIKFPFKNVALYGSLRLLRFLIYGLIIFNVL